MAKAPQRSGTRSTRKLKKTTKTLEGSIRQLEKTIAKTEGVTHDLETELSKKGRDPRKRR